MSGQVIYILDILFMLKALIIGVDNVISLPMAVGRHSFNRKSLHAISRTPNPYEQAISIVGRTLSPFDEDNLIPCFGFGDGQCLL